jgi:putative spermidine/putrescine transport system permease protein
MSALRFRPQILLRTFCWLIVGFLILPNLVAIPASLTPAAYFSMPRFGDYSLRHYAALVEDERWVAALWTSVQVAVLSTALAATLSSAAAIGLALRPSRLASAIRFVVLAPLIVPAVVSGLAFYKTWASLNWLDTLHGLVIAHAILVTPFIFIMVSASVASLDPALLNAARSLGAGPWRTIQWVILPNIRTALIGGSLVAFLVSWDEVIATTFLTSFRMETLPKRILFVVRDDLDPSVAAASVAIMAMTLALILAAAATRKKDA